MKIVFIFLVVSLLLLGAYVQAEQVQEQKEPEMIKVLSNPNLSIATAHMGVAIIENPEKRK